MTFNEFEYTRPAIEDIAAKFNIALEEFKAAESYEIQNIALKNIISIREAFSTMHTISSIRHTVNTKDEFYENENTYYDQNMPSYQALITEFYKALTQSKFRTALEEKWGKQLFVIADLSLKTFEPSILEDLQEENKLSSEYVKLKATAAIEFEGETYNLSSIIPLISHKDRATRKAANEARWKFFSDHATQFENIFDQLVKVRHRIAQKLGYENFIELGYARMLRSDYTPEMVANFRKQVEEHIVPITVELRQRQAKRLGLDALKYYDEGLAFLSGNAKPQGSPEWIIDKAHKMYSDLSEETKHFFEFMQDNGLMDLVAKDGKATGGYCTFIGKYQSPYIFSNFNGTSGDIDVLTHEAGHAFQVFESRSIGIPEYNWPTYEACEIHSMSMEFFTWPWMKLFFEGDTEKYKFSHLSGAINFLPYGVAVDEFQHYVYENPTATPKERNLAWRKIEQKYLPFRDYDGHEYLEGGGFWQRQNHIFASPFYYIDYTLAQICAFQFWKKDQENHDAAWADYVELCQAGGSQSFLDLVKLAKLRSPFEDGCVASVTGLIKDWLDAVDDTKF